MCNKYSSFKAMPLVEAKRHTKRNVSILIGLFSPSSISKADSKAGYTNFKNIVK